MSAVQTTATPKQRSYLSELRRAYPTAAQAGEIDSLSVREASAEIRQLVDHAARWPWRPLTKQSIVADAAFRFVHGENREFGPRDFDGLEFALRPSLQSWRPLTFRTNDRRPLPLDEARAKLRQVMSMVAPEVNRRLNGAPERQPEPEPEPEPQPEPESAPEPQPEPEPAPEPEQIDAFAHEVSPYVERLVRANIPVYLYGPAGTGKSSAAKYAADRLGLDYYEINLAGAMASAVRGRDTMSGFVASVFTEAYENGGVLCLEEFDAAHPTVATAINNALANGHYANDATGKNHTRHPSFRVVATANTLGTGATKEFTGRMRLDGATLDRFRVGRVFVGLDTRLERSILKATLGARQSDPAWHALYGRIESLRAFNRSHNGFDAMDSMRLAIDAAKAYLCGADANRIVSSIVAHWSEDSIRQAGESRVISYA